MPGARTTSHGHPEGGATVVHLAADVELPGIAGALGPLAARAVKRGVDANFATLKQILEATAGEAGSASV